SGTMHKWVSHVESAVKSLPPGFDVKLVLADSDLIDATTIKDLASSPDEIYPALNYANFAGGADNMPALLKAWNLAAEKPGNNAIVWIHDPQRLHLYPVEELRRRWESRPYGPVLYSVRTAIGSDEVENRLDGINEVKSVPRIDYLATDLKKLFARLTSKEKTLEFVRTSTRVEHPPLVEDAIETSDH